MQLIPRYLVNNRVNIVADMAGFITEYRPVYSRQLQVYKGIDNVIQFRLMNADQRPVDATGYTPVFVAVDENRSLVVERECVIQDDGSSGVRGLFSVTITENDLLNRGYDIVTLNVGRDNPDARRLYERFGYNVVGDEPGRWSYLDHNGKRHYVHEPSWRMEKSLSLESP